MNAFAKLALGVRVAGLRRHDRWTGARLAKHQARQLARLVRFARARSPFYARALAGLDAAPLDALPTLSRQVLMTEWDDLVTDRALRLAELRRFLDRRPAPDALFDGRYHVMSTSGTTGTSTVFCYSTREWVDVMASGARQTAWRGIGPSRRACTALVLLPGQDVPPPMGARMAASLRTLFPRTVMIDASLPMADLVTQLEAATPDIISAYASTLAALAEEQLAGRLHIKPRAVQSTSEILSPAARERITRAFGVPLHDGYAMTEAGFVAGTCAEQRGLHVEDDGVILEVLDEAGHPAPRGTFGARVLLTVLWSRTLPLIRYEITDRVCLATEPCPCGRPYTLIAEIDGRAGDVLTLAGDGGRAVRVTPSQLQRVLAAWPLAAWQVRREGAQLEVRVVPSEPGFDAAACRQAVHRALAESGVAHPSIDVRVVERIAPLPSGKVPRFVLL